jgi:hypothetical protein
MTRADQDLATGMFAPDTGARARTLDRMTAHATEIRGVWAKDVRAGDWIVVHTRNSVYSLAVLGDGTYAVAGGWFSAAGAESKSVRVSGCTWGGHAILTGMVAAPGMCLEFANGVRTTRIREVQLIPSDDARPH